MLVNENRNFEKTIDFEFFAWYNKFISLMEEKRFPCLVHGNETRDKLPYDGKPIGGFMSKASIHKIQETEAQAEAMIADARRRAQDAIAEAEKSGRLALESAERETAESLSAMLGQIRERTNSMRERQAAESEEAAAELRQSVSLRRKAAEKIVIRGFERKCR